MKSKRGSIQSYGSIANVEGYEPIPDGSDYEEDEDLNGNCKLKTLKCHLETALTLLCKTRLCYRDRNLLSPYSENNMFQGGIWLYH